MWTLYLFYEAKIIVCWLELYQYTSSDSVLLRSTVVEMDRAEPPLRQTSVRGDRPRLSRQIPKPYTARRGNVGRR